MSREHKQHRCKIAIRPATPADADFILSLVPRFASFKLPKGRSKRGVTSAIRSEIQRALREPRPAERFFIAEDAAGHLCGFLHLRAERDFVSGQRACHISNIAVVRSHDGQGIGGALLANAHRWAKAHRCKWLTLNVLPGNARARALYEHSGFSPDMIRMAKPLT
ncbi:MAG: GNAT family N-acetyltransferase [Rhodanobacteraceae bacterium]|nr:MAG: GNAT family N-acetyltransferase [Rhodanobacteraceae bacterium]